MANYKHRSNYCCHGESSVGGEGATSRNILAHADICSQISLFGGEISEDVKYQIGRVNEITEAYGVPEEILKVLAIKQLFGAAGTWIYVKEDLNLKLFKFLRETFTTYLHEKLN